MYIQSIQFVALHNVHVKPPCTATAIHVHVHCTRIDLRCYMYTTINKLTVNVIHVQCKESVKRNFKRQFYFQISLHKLTCTMKAYTYIVQCIIYPLQIHINYMYMSS